MSFNCELCTQPGGELLWSDQRCRVVRVTGPEAEAFPGFCRIVWNAHVAEMSELAADDATHLMAVVRELEQALRDLLAPDKINLASLGNAVPHLHWHVIPRWRDDSHFPRPIWAEPLRPKPTQRVASVAAALVTLPAVLSGRIAARHEIKAKSAVNAGRAT